jgi:hypothetical protein
VITASTGSDTTYYIDLGLTNATYNNTNPNNSLGTSIEGLDGYLYVQGSAGNPGGNLIIGTTVANTETRFIASGINSSNVVAKATATGLNITNNHYLTFGDSTTQTTAAASNAYSQAAFALANTNSSNITVLQAVNTTQNTWISANTAYSQAAFAKANSALANSTGTFGGDLTISGSVSVNGTFVLSNSLFTATQSALTISGTSTVTTPSNDGYMLHLSGKQGVSNRIVGDAYGTGAYVVYAGRSARGTPSAPTAMQSGDVLMRISGNGYGSTGYASIGTSRIDFVAAENWTDSARGSQIQFWNTPAGSNVQSQIATFNGTSVTFTGSVTPQKGFIYTPTVYSGSTTSVTIDFANNSVLRAQSATGITVSFSNYTAGKMVEMWFTNTAGNGQTFTHGVSATNSTTGSTTYNITSGATILARYFCIDGTLANTFCAIVHA